VFEDLPERAMRMFREDERVSAAVDQRAGSATALGSIEPTGYASGAVDEVSAGTQIVRERPAGTPAQLRVDFGAHLEANYQRLVAQLYAITLDPGEAHDVVQDAYSRAWRNWAEIGRSPDPSAWIRWVAVRSTIRSWRRFLATFGIGRPKAIGEGADPRTRALLSALGRLPLGERRAVVLCHMAGASAQEVAALERVPVGLIESRLTRARHVITDGMADVLSDVLRTGSNEGTGGDSYYDPRPDAASVTTFHARGAGSAGGDVHDDGGERR
jgi:RNA polymerase sigma factor (sigma-70 family)